MPFAPRSEIRNKETNPLFVKLSVVSRSLNEKNDCTVKALAVAARIPYRQAHEDLRSMGRRNGKGFYTMYVLKMLREKYGKRVVQCPDLTEFVRNNYPKGRNGYKGVTMVHFDRYREVFGNRRFIALVRGHVAVYDGENGLVDWSQGRSLRLKELFEILD